MRLMLTAAAIVLSAASTAPAWAQDAIPARGVFKQGTNILSLCSSTKPADVDACDYYLMAAYDMASYFQDTGQAEATFCMPKGTTALTLRNAVTAYWRKKPDSQKYSAVSNIVNALDEAYPGACKK